MLRPGVVETSGTVQDMLRCCKLPGAAPNDPRTAVTKHVNSCSTTMLSESGHNRSKVNELEATRNPSAHTGCTDDF